MAIDIPAKLQQSKLYFANLMDKYVDTYVFGISVSDCASDKTEYAYTLIEALEYQMQKGLGIDNATTLAIYEKLDCITPIYNTPVTIDESLLTPISNNPISGLVVYFSEILGNPYDNFNLSVALDAKFDNPTGLSTEYLDGLGDPQPFPDTASSFLDLTDTPDTYAGQAGKATVVNELETALVFVDFPSSETTAPITADLTVGGIDAGEVVPAGTNIQELAELLLTTTFYPTYTIPTITISGNQSGIKEVGTSLTQSLTISGIENDSGPFTLLNILRNGALISTTSTPTQTSEADISSQFGYPDPNNPNYKYTLLYNDAYSIVLGNNDWNGNGTYLGSEIPSSGYGLPKKDNKGVFDTRTALVRSVNAPQLGNIGFASNTINVTGLYPYFYYKSSSPITSLGMVTAIENGSATKVVASSAGTLSIPYNVSAQYLAVAYPSSSTTKTVYFVTTLDSGAITLVFNPVATESVDSATGLWSNIDYKIHTSQEAITNSNTTIELRNS